MWEPVIVAFIIVILGWGIWKTRDWKPANPDRPIEMDLEQSKFLNEIHRETGKLSVRLDKVESENKNIRSEWDNYRSSVDSIVRRGIRHKVIEAQTEEETPVTTGDERPPISRSELLRAGLRGNNRA